MDKPQRSYAFPGSNTTNGYVSLFPSGLQYVDRVYILKGGPGCGKSTLMHRLAKEMLEQGLAVELWPCASDSESLDGVLIPELSLAVIDGTAPHIVDPRYPGAVESLIDLGCCWDGRLLRQKKQQIIDLSNASSACYTRCFSILQEVADVLGEIKDRHSSYAPDVCRQHKDSLLATLFPDNAPRCRHLFASAVTPRGLVNYAEQLSRQAANRYLLVGPPGGGREQLIDEIAQAAEARGYDMEIYHSALQPQQIELLLLPQQDTALLLLDTVPDTLREGDTVINCGSYHTEDQPCLQQIEQLTEQAGQQVAAAKKIHDSIEDIYMQAVDYSKVEQIVNRLLVTAHNLAVQKGDE